MFSKTFLVLCYLTLAYSVNMRLYDLAGNYTLGPENYDYQDSIIIELWGAGSGSFEYSDPTRISQCGGNSGSYVKMLINTFNNETFYFTLGKGGEGNISFALYGTKWSFPGENSIFYTLDYNLFLNVSGGAGSTEYECGTVNAKVENLTHRTDDIVIKAMNGTLSSMVDIVTTDGCTCFCNYGYGAASPYGANGGNYYNTIKCDGYMGSGAGYNCNYCKFTEYYHCNRTYKGGDGALIVYY